MNTIIFDILYSLSDIELLKDLALFFSYYVGYLLPLILIAWALFFQKRRMYSFSIIFLSIVLVLFLGSILKLIIGIPRPFITKDIIPAFYESGFSFPSLHMAIFTSLAYCSYFLNKRIGIAMFVITLFVGLSRVIIGVHYPLDIVVGFVLGSIVALFIIHIFRKI